MKIAKIKYVLAVGLPLVLISIAALTIAAGDIPAILREPGRAIRLICNPPHHGSRIQVLKDSLTCTRMPLYQVFIEARLAGAPGFMEIADHNVGECAHIHRGDKDLLGVHVQQFPDCQYYDKLYEGRHPFMIIYVFKNNTAHQLSYEPDGALREDSWRNIREGDPILDNLDVRCY